MSTKTPKSISREEKYLDKIGGNDEVIVPKPISREEKYMYRAAGYDDQPIPDYPIGRNEKYWAKIVENGGGSSTLIEKNITENGVYNATDDNADGYSSVTVDIPKEDYNATLSGTPDGIELRQNLIEINIPSGITKISGQGFISCAALKKVTFPNSITEIGIQAFQDCHNLGNIVLPNNLTTIKAQAFNGCLGFTSITIPNSVTSIANNAFANCSNLTEIIVNKPEGSISGAPWGATNAQIIWTG